MRSIVFYFSLLIPAALFGQNHYTLNGKVIDFTTRKVVSEGLIRLYYEDYTKADTVRETVWLDLLGERKKDTVYLKPKNIKVDSVTLDREGSFSFYKLKEGLYRVTCKIKIDTIGYKYDFREHVLINNDSVIVELTPEIYCEYRQYQNQSFCPICLKIGNCLKVIYGLPQYDPSTNGILSKKGEYWIGYCEIDRFCFARWYCTKCDKLF